MTTLEIYRAVPPASRRARGQREWIRALSADLELSGLQPRTQRAILAAARVLMRCASWIDRTTRPTRARICALAGISVSTWKRVRRWLEDHGYLGTVRQGWTPVLRAAPLVDPGTPNEAAVYVLCVPRARRRENGQRPPVVAGQPGTGPLTSERSERGLSPARELPRTPGSDDGTPLFVVAYLRSQVAELRRGPGKNLTDRAVLAIARPFLAARWSPADLARAIGHDPVTGKAHRTSIAGVRQPASWLAWRLTRWCHDPGQAWKSWHALGRWDHDAWPAPGPSPSGRVLAAAAAARAAAGPYLSRGPGADPQPFATRIREQLGWKRRAPDQGARRVRWIHYPSATDHQARLGGRPRQGQLWAGGPRPGTVWAIPDDLPERICVLVHHYPDAPEMNYALASEQTQPAPDPGPDHHHQQRPARPRDGQPPR